MEKQFKIVRRNTQDERIAHLMGLSLEEYNQLSHSGIREIRDLKGEVLYYYTIVSPLNPESILAKIKMDRKRMVHFPPDVIDVKDLPIDVAV